MKQFCLVLLFAILGLYSCHKDSSPSPNSNPINNQEFHSVQFNVNTFDVTYSDIPQGRTAGIQERMDGLSNYINVINYFVYDSLGKLVNRISQNSSMTNFGFIHDSLKTGEYTIVVGAIANTQIWPNPDSVNYYPKIKLDSLTLTNVFQRDPFYPFFSGFDLFLYKSKIKVDNRDTVFNTITPARISGKLEVKLLDTLPVNTTIYYSINNIPNPDYYLIANGAYTRWGVTISSTSKPLENILGSNTPLSINITVKNKFSPFNILISKTIPNVYVYPNKKTILTGKISDTQNTNINISVDSSYAGVVYQNF